MLPPNFKQARIGSYPAQAPESQNHKGDLHGATWNAQGFIMARSFGYAKKRATVAAIFHSRDFIAFVETPSTPESVNGYCQVPGTTALWSSGTAARTGVGIIMQHKFLEQFGERELL